MKTKSLRLISKKALFFTALLVMTLIAGVLSVSVSAADVEQEMATREEIGALLTETAANSVSAKAWAAGLVVALAALGGAIAMGFAIAKAVEGISRQPEADGKIRTALMLGLVFIETVVIYALIVAILIIFVL